MVKTNQVFCTYMKLWVWCMRIAFGSPSTEEICNCFTIPTAKNNVGHLLMVFCVNEFDLYPLMPWIDMAETNFKREKEKIFCTL